MEPTGPPRGETEDAATSEDDLDETPLDADEIDFLRAAAHAPGGDVGGSLIGAQLGRYRVVELLGSGGMGVVYRATRHDRARQGPRDAGVHVPGAGARRRGRREDRRVLARRDAPRARDGEEALRRGDRRRGPRRAPRGDERGRGAPTRDLERARGPGREVPRARTRAAARDARGRRRARRAPERDAEPRRDDGDAASVRIGDLRPAPRPPPSASEAEDAFSLFAEKLWSTMPRFEHNCSMRTWAYLLARRASTDVRRSEGARAKRHVVLSQASQIAELVAQVRTATLSIYAQENKDAIARLRDELPEEDRLLLVLRVDRELEWNDLPASSSTRARSRAQRS